MGESRRWGRCCRPEQFCIESDGPSRSRIASLPSGKLLTEQVVNNLLVSRAKTELDSRSTS
jgi:hypothetical protein